MKLEEFDKFVDMVLSNLDSCSKEEYWGTQREICEDFLEQARSMIFHDVLREQEEYEKYLELKAKFEPEAK